MQLHTIHGAIFALAALQIIGLKAYPMLAIPYFHDAADGSKFKKSDLSFLQTDDDVLELEHLKRNHNDDHADGTLPELERQLESATPSIAMTTGLPESAKSEIISGQPEKEQTDVGVHRPPVLPHQESTKPQNTNGNQQQAVVLDFGVGNGGASPLAPSMTKPFYGAARLAFGQNPEVFPTSSTSSTTTTTTIVPETETNENSSSESVEKVLEVDQPASESITPSTTTTTTTTSLTNAATTPLDHSYSHSPLASTTTAAPTVEEVTQSHEMSTATVAHPFRPHNANSAVTSPKPNKNEDEHTREVAGDVFVGELDKIKSATRRSVPQMSPKTAENLLSHGDGRYSPFEMAQYVFWTGDEAGVAHAVEELIEKGLMSRENALKFLRDIRLGIDYLQRSFENRVFSQELRQNNIKKNFPTLSITMPTTTSTTTTTTTTENPLPRVHLERTMIEQNNPNLFQALEDLAKYNGLQEVNNNQQQQQELPDYEEATGKAKLANFLYSEYTLEEILYKLAKVMFTQSLTHGSDEAQRELQKLTDFLEREGNLGIIPTDLQRKILNVLLTALSDTLAEHPELLPAARINLVNQNRNHYMKLPTMHAYGSIQ